MTDLQRRAIAMAGKMGRVGMWHASSGCGKGEVVLGCDIRDLILELEKAARNATRADR